MLALPHLATTYAAVNTLVTIRSERALPSINRDNLYRFMLWMKDSSGAFRMHEGVKLTKVVLLGNPMLKLMQQIRPFIKDTVDRTVFVLNVRDPFQRLLLHGVCEEGVRTGTRSSQVGSAPDDNAIGGKYANNDSDNCNGDINGGNNHDANNIDRDGCN